MISRQQHNTTATNDSTKVLYVKIFQRKSAGDCQEPVEEERLAGRMCASWDRMRLLGLIDTWD
jgi:hypothetical protein